MTSRRGQIRRLRAVATCALREFALPDGRLTFVTHGENTTFRLSTTGGDYLVRVHRPQRHGADADSEASIASELDWLRAIRTDTSLEVPTPVAARDGRAVVLAASGGQERLVTVLEWMSGAIREPTPRPVHLSRLGTAMATLHEHADSWRPPPSFTRIAWDYEAFFGDAMVYGNLTAAECWDRLPAALRSRFEEVGERLAALIADSSDTGLIHADLHLGNVLFERGRVKLIDFDDSGTGPRAYELAVALWELRERPDYQDFHDALVSAYTARRALDVTHLDDFIALRQVAFDVWFTGMASVNPKMAANLRNVHEWSAQVLDLVFAR